ncbi:MAG TPA: hypothetical protein PK684_04050 [Bacillota bacterium]|nr:hypothetical protein [Bacillota bacterium]
MKACCNCGKEGMSFRVICGECHDAFIKGLKQVKEALEIIDELITVSDLKAGGNILRDRRSGLVYIDQETRDLLKKHIADINELLRE